jgi:hypothetical protein
MFVRARMRGEKKRRKNDDKLFHSTYIAEERIKEYDGGMKERKGKERKKIRNRKI